MSPPPQPAFKVGMPCRLLIRRTTPAAALHLDTETTCRGSHWHTSGPCVLGKPLMSRKCRFDQSVRCVATLVVLTRLVCPCRSVFFRNPLQSDATLSVSQPKAKELAKGAKADADENKVQEEEGDKEQDASSENAYWTVGGEEAGSSVTLRLAPYDEIESDKPFVQAKATPSASDPQVKLNSCSLSFFHFFVPAQRSCLTASSHSALPKHNEHSTVRGLPVAQQGWHPLPSHSSREELQRGASAPPPTWRRCPGARGVCVPCRAAAWADDRCRIIRSES